MKTLLIISLLWIPVVFARKVDPAKCDAITEGRYQLNIKIMRYEYCKKNPKDKKCPEMTKYVKTISDQSRALYILQEKTSGCGIF